MAGKCSRAGLSQGQILGGGGCLGSGPRQADKGLGVVRQGFGSEWLKGTSAWGVSVPGPQDHWDLSGWGKCLLSSLLIL